MSQCAMRTALRSADVTPSTCFDLDDLKRWPPEQVAALQCSGVLEPAGFTTSIICPGCEEHCLVEVEFLDDPGGGPPRAYVICEERDDIGRVSIPLERLQLWRVSAIALAGIIGAQLGADDGLQERVSERLWCLGEVASDDLRGDVYLARGTQWDDAAHVFSQPGVFRERSPSVVLTLSDAPAEGVFADQTEAVPLAGVLSVRNGMLKVSKRALTAAVGRAQRRPKASPGEPAADPVLVIRPKSYQAILHGKELGLSRRSFELLLYLAQQVVERGGGWALRDSIYDAIWAPGGQEPTVNLAQVDDTVRELRASLDEAETDSGMRVIDSRRSLGYRLLLEPAEIAIHPG